MSEAIEIGFMAFLADGAEGIGAVRETTPDNIVIYVENAGEFVIPRAAVRDVHSQKVVLNASLLDRALLDAIKHIHDREDPAEAG